MNDTSKKALLGASLRYIHKFNIRDWVIGFIELKDMDATVLLSESEKFNEIDRKNHVKTIFFTERYIIP